MPEWIELVCAVRDNTTEDSHFVLYQACGSVHRMGKTSPGGGALDSWIGLGKCLEVNCKHSSEEQSKHWKLTQEPRALLPPPDSRKKQQRLSDTIDLLKLPQLLERNCGDNWCCFLRGECPICCPLMVLKHWTEAVLIIITNVLEWPKQIKLLQGPLPMGSFRPSISLRLEVMPFLLLELKCGTVYLAISYLPNRCFRNRLKTYLFDCCYDI